MVNVTRDTFQCIPKVSCRIKVGSGEANIGMIPSQGLAVWATYGEQERDD